MLTTADGRIVAKVADVGITRALAFSDMHGAVVENPIWLAPEVMLRKGYTEKVDVYSYGVMLWELLTRQGFFEEIPYM
jgi:serine/threonine protein kinase